MGPGPARVILKEKKNGSLKYHGVVSHNQKATSGSKGYMDHHRVLPSIRKTK